MFLLEQFLSPVVSPTSVGLFSPVFVWKTGFQKVLSLGIKRFCLLIRPIKSLWGPRARRVASPSISCHWQSELRAWTKPLLWAPLPNGCTCKGTLDAQPHLLGDIHFAAQLWQSRGVAAEGFSEDWLDQYPYHCLCQVMNSIITCIGVPQGMLICTWLLIICRLWCVCAATFV